MGFLPELEVVIETGRIAVHVPRKRDRGANADIWRPRLNKLLAPLHLREAKSLEKLLSWLYLNSLTIGNLSKVLASPFKTRCRWVIYFDFHTLEIDLVGKISSVA